MTPVSSAARSHLTLVRPEAESKPSDRRTHPRLTLSELEWLNSVRLKYGPTVSLIDLSTGGAQIESSTRLQPGSTVVVQISGADGEIALPSNVLRSYVSRVTPYTVYRSALAFKRAFEAPQQPGSERGADSAAQVIREHGRLAAAIRQLSQLPTAGATGLALAGDSVLTSTLTLIDSPSARRGGTRFKQNLTQVFRTLTTDIDAGISVDMMLSRLAEQLRRSVPAKTIRIVQAGAAIGPHGPDTVYFDATVDGRSVARLVVEFPNSCQLEDWHLQFLKTAAQLVAVIGEVGQLRAASIGKTRDATDMRTAAASVGGIGTLADTATPASSLKQTVRLEAEGDGRREVNALIIDLPWEPVVVRYLDGRVLKGFSRAFMPARGHLQVWPAPEAPAASAISVPLRHLKAVFFVQDLQGAPPNGATPAPARGRRIIVTFLDDEVLAGTTLNYSADGPGFFVSPSEERGNNLRIFAVTAAIRHVQFP